MNSLSEQLDDLSSRAKKTEDVVAAARDKNRAKLDEQKAELRTSIAAAGAAAGAHADAGRGKVSTWWSDTKASVDARFAARQARSDERHYEHDLKKALRQADDAEADAADAVALALYLLDEAEYAVIDAVVTRAVADDLALEE